MSVENCLGQRGQITLEDLAIVGIGEGAEDLGRVRLPGCDLGIRSGGKVGPGDRLVRRANVEPAQAVRLDDGQTTPGMLERGFAAATPRIVNPRATRESSPKIQARSPPAPEPCAFQERQSDNRLLDVA